MWMRISTPGKSALPRSNNGITLIELLAALAIVGIIFALAATALRDTFDVGLKSSARRLGSLSRFLRTKAVTEHKYVRLVLDLEKSEYAVEESKTPFVISVAKEEGMVPQEEEKKPEVSTTETGVEGADAEAPEFIQAEGLVVRPTSLESGAKFKDVSVSYLPGKREGGKVNIYFFPDGYATPAMINLKDEDDEDHFSIEILPMTGRVTIEGEYRELER